MDIRVRRAVSVALFISLFHFSILDGLAETHVNTAAASAQKTAEREQALAALDDASQLARIGALEDILSSSDVVLIDFATRKVLSGTDREMRKIILRHTLAKSTHPFYIRVGACQGPQSTCERYSNLLQGVVLVDFNSFDEKAGTFKTIMHSATSSPNRQTYTRDGKINNIGILFEINLGPVVSNLSNCVGEFDLSATGVMDGSLRCNEYSFPAFFSLV